MQLSIVILNYNVKHFLQLCLASVFKAITNLEAEVIVVDNASTDGSKELMETAFPDAIYLYQTVNSGFPKGNNIGVEHAKGEFICILNPDTIVAEDTFEILLKEYQSLKNPGILGCKLIDGAGHFLPESKRGTPTPWVALTKVLALYKLFPKFKAFNQYYAQDIASNESGKVAILVGAFMLMKRDLYVTLGGFDEKCFMYSDDIDLSYLSLKNGYYNYYLPSTTVVHFKGESTLKDGLYMKRFKEAMQFFYKKHFKTSTFFNYFMYFGIFLFAFKKKSEKSKKSFKTPDYYFLVTTNESLINWCSDRFKNIKIFKSINDIPLESKSEKIEYLFDSHSITYKEYINFIHINSNANKAFKIKPQNVDFFIGSNDKNEKGEVLHLN